MLKFRNFRQFFLKN